MSKVFLLRTTAVDGVGKLPWVEVSGSLDRLGAGEEL